EPRGRPQGHHGQLRRPGPDRDSAPRRALPGRPDRGAAGGDRPSPLGNAARVRGRRVLPRLRTRAVRHRPDRRRRRRSEAAPVLRRHVTPWRALGALVVLLLLTVLILVRIPSGQYILLPDIAHPFAPLVKVEGAHTPSGAGSIYFLDVIEKKASEFEKLFPWIHSDATFEPANDVVPPCSSTQQALQAQLQEMAFSQRVAATVALRRLGYHVVVRPTGVVVSQLIAGTNAPCNLQPMDIIIAVNGTPTATEVSLHEALARVNPGSVVVLRVRRGSKTLTVRVRTI